MLQLHKKYGTNSFKYLWYFAVFGILIIAVYILNGAFMYDTVNKFKSCIKSDDKSLYNLNTKLGVTYDGSHWFHIAENFMTQHSILRTKQLQSCTQHIYFNLDKPGFVHKLNGVTKLFIILGTFKLSQDTSVCKVTKTYKFYFTHLVDTINNNGIKFHESNQNLLIEKDNIKEILLETISPQVITTKRFIQKQNINVFESTAYSSEIIAAPTKQRLLQDLRGTPIINNNSNDISNSIPTEQCLKGIDTIGGMWPTVQRGHWFPHSGDVESFRDKIKFLCPLDTLLLEANKKKKRYKLAIYQRDISRKLVEQEHVIQLLYDKLSINEWEIVVIMHKSDRSPCEITHLLNNVDVLVTPHGFQSMLLLFMSRPSVIFEVFPYRYYKRAYGPLSVEYGIIHGGSMSPPLSWFNYLLLSNVKTQWCMENKYCRGFARNSNVMLTPNGVNKLVNLVNTYIINNYKTNKSFDRLYG